MALNEQIEKAVNWWAKQLTSEGESWDNGANHLAGGLMGVLGNSTLSNARSKINKDQIDDFKLALAGIIEREIQGRPHLVISTDYYPDGKLAKAFEKSGIPVGVKEGSPLPCKTVMWVYKDKVRVRPGYGATVIEL